MSFSRPLRVLTLDGGGTRGLYTATLLECLAQRFAKQQNRGPLDIGKGFDLIVGTSTGGILACALAQGVPIREIVDLYRNAGPKIFSNPQPQWLPYFLWWCLKSFFRAANSAQPLKDELQDIFGETTLKELYDKRNIALCVTAVKLVDESFRVFKTPHFHLKNLDDEVKLRDACLATSAAPIFLPLSALKSPSDPRRVEFYADGGLAANNPVLVGLVEALQMADNKRPIHILSVGTCSAPEGSVLQEGQLNRGLFQWKVGVKALSLSMNTQAAAAQETATYLARCLSSQGREVKVFRFPEKRLSEAHMKFLKMDLASKEALDSFAAFGSEDAISAYSLCQKPDNEEGKIITDIFTSMPSLNT